MLFSQAPNDTPSMLAHFDKVVGKALLLFNLTQIGAADTVRRRQVEIAFSVLASSNEPE